MSGYVFLFIYGLERRLIVDATLVSAGERQQIMEEVAALLDIYGGKSNSLRGYADALLDWVTLSQDHADLYNKAVPAFARSMELPFYMRLALGKTAVDRAEWSLKVHLKWLSSRSCVRRVGQSILRSVARAIASTWRSSTPVHQVAMWSVSRAMGVPTARNRDRLRQHVLEGLGWRIHRIWSTDWWVDPKAEV